MCDCVQHDLGPFHRISIYVSIQGREGGGGGDTGTLHLVDNIWFLFSLAGAQTDVWINLLYQYCHFFFGLLQILLVHVCHFDAYVKHFFL